MRTGLRDWWSRLIKIAQETRGIEQVVGIAVYGLTLTTLTEWVHIVFGTKNRPLLSFTDPYVVVVLVLTVWIYLAPSVFGVWVSVYFSASTVIVLLNIVLFQRLFEDPASPGRSLLLFICNVAQIILMFATWYRLYGEPPPITDVDFDVCDHQPRRKNANYRDGSNCDELLAVDNLPESFGRPAWGEARTCLADLTCPHPIRHAHAVAASY